MMKLLFACLVSLLISIPSLADGEPFSWQEAPGFLVPPVSEISDLEGALKRAEMLLEDGQVAEGHGPVTFVLHGPEVGLFFQDGYGEHRELLGLAAKLSAFNVVDIRVCETQTGVLGRDKSNLVPFVTTVPFGPDEEKRLIEEGYVYF